MDSGNVIIESDMAYPILFMPKKCTKLETNCDLSDNVYIKVSITSPDTEGNSINVYSGFCNVKLVDSYDMNLNRVESPDSSDDIERMPVILSEAIPPYTQSQVWIDPSRSPYVYNHYDPSSQEQYSVRESGGIITVEQHNTYITQNVYNCNESNVYNYMEARQSPVRDFECKRYRKQTLTRQPKINMSYEENKFECGVFLSQQPEEILNEKQTEVREESKYPGHQENSALKQLMSTDIQSTSKQRKTILFLGHDSHSGQTIQNISYNDPLVTCAEIEVDNEVIIDETSSPNPKKKKYQCDKCKQIFDQISSFRQHMVGNHTSKPTQPEKELTFMCTDCGKNLKNQNKFEKHCLGHGDPDLECPKCRRVFASKFSLRVHMKIHSRKHPCNYCSKTYGSYEDLRTHMRRIHILYMCRDENCAFVTSKHADLEHHQHWHVENEQAVDDPEDLDLNLKSEVQTLDQDIMQSRAKLTSPNQDLSRSSENLTQEGMNQESSKIYTNQSSDLKESNQEQFGSNESFVQSSVLKESNQDVFGPSQSIQSSVGSPVEDNDGERIRKADSVIAKVMSDTIFLLSSKKARRHRCRKTCEVCLKPFDRIDDLKRHLIEHVIKSTLAKTPVTRSGSLKITCEVCQIETFSRVDKYKAHLREHAKLTIYKCTFCDKSFSDSSNFSKHKKIHGVSYLQCDLCQRKFNSKKMIAQHMDNHNKTSPVECSYCNRLFHFESMLNKHIRCAHRKEETSKYRCRFCDDMFRSLKEKWDHEWSAHNVRKVVVDCHICKSQFRKYSELKRHCLDEHGVDIPPAKKLRNKYPKKVYFD